MALTVAIDLPNMNVVGSKRQVPVVITFDSSYATGGEAITAAMVGLVVLERFIFEGAISATDGATGFVARFNKASSTIQALKANGTTNLIEVTSTTDLSAQSVRAVAVGY